ncbi:MAG: hypothetical protein ACLQVM_07955 [Terriglobia bacterium]
MNVCGGGRRTLACTHVLAFAKSFVARVAAAHPGELTVEHSIAARRNRVYLDPFRNALGPTAVAPYSVRRRPFPRHWNGPSQAHARAFGLQHGDLSAKPPRSRPMGRLLSQPAVAEAGILPPLPPFTEPDARAEVAPL